MLQAAAAEKDNAELQQAVSQQVDALKKAKADLQKAEKQQQERYGQFLAFAASCLLVSLLRMQLKPELCLMPEVQNLCKDQD